MVFLGLRFTHGVFFGCFLLVYCCCMPPNFSKNFANTSLSGDETMQEAADTASSSETKVDIRYVLSAIIFALSLVGVGATFGVNAYFDREIAALDSQIQQLEDAVKTSSIVELDLFDKQLRTLSDLAVSRNGYSLLLDEIAGLVVPGVYYTSASLSFDENSNEYNLVLNGFADSLITYHQQIQRIESVQQGLLAEPRFDSYALQWSERNVATVSFVVSYTVPVSEISAMFSDARDSVT